MNYRGPAPVFTKGTRPVHIDESHSDFILVGNLGVGDIWIGSDPGAAT